MRQRQRDELRRCAAPARRSMRLPARRLRLPVAAPAACGAGRTSNEAGISSAQATMPITSIAVRQS